MDLILLTLPDFIHMFTHSCNCRLSASFPSSLGESCERLCALQFVLKSSCIYQVIFAKYLHLFNTMKHSSVTNMQQMEQIIVLLHYNCLGRLCSAHTLRAD